MKNKYSLLYGAGLVLTGVAPTAHAAVINNLGTLGGSYSRGFGINASGQVTGGSNAAPGSGDNRGYLYTGGTMHDLGTLGGPISFAFAINSSGHVAGSSLFSPTSGAQRAFLYTGIPGADGMMHDLGTLGGTSSRATALNDSDQLTGNSGITVGSTAAHAFRYVGTPGAGGMMQDLGTLGGATSRGYGINASGQIVGDSQITGGASTTFHAFFYTGTPGAGGTMTDLGTLGGTISAANAINDSGQIAGASQTTGSSDYHAFLYTGTPGAGGMMRDLGTLGGSSSAAYAINTSGQMVGASDTTGDTATHAMIYTGKPGLDGVMTDLDAWLDAFHPAEGANWTLEDASWMTDTGLITGSGQYDDGPGGLADGLRAYILDASAISMPIPGDANFDGKVDVTDLGILATNWQMSGTRAQGDFDGSGFVDVTDLGLLATNWQAGVAGESASLAAALQSFGLSASLVPEPGVFGVLAQPALLYCLRARPRRRPPQIRMNRRRCGRGPKEPKSR